MDSRSEDTSELMPWRRGHGYGHASFSTPGTSNHSPSHGHGHRRSASSGSWATSGVGRAPAALLLVPPMPSKPQLLSSKSEGSVSFSAHGISSSFKSASLAPASQTAVNDVPAIPASRKIAAATSGSRGTVGRGRRPSGFMDNAVHPMAAPFRFPAVPGVMMARSMSADDLSPLSRSSSLSKKLPAFSFPAVSVTRPDEEPPVLALEATPSFPLSSTYSDAIGAWSKTTTAPATGTSVKHPATPGQRDAIADNEPGSGCPGAKFQRSKEAPEQQSYGQPAALTGTGAGASDGAIGWSWRNRSSCGGARDGGGHGGFSGCERAATAWATTEATAKANATAPSLQGAQVPAWRSPWGSSFHQQQQQQRHRRLVSSASCSASLASSSPSAACPASSSSSTTLTRLASTPPPLATTTPTCRRSASTADLAKLHTPSSSISSNVSAVSCATSASTASSVFSGHHHPQQHLRSVSAPRSRRRSSRPSLSMPEYRHGRAASLSISSSNGRGANAAGGLARSPPNTAHVPCKFFRQGACQAGNACPFSHDLTLSADTVCKYFAKGNCKFGPKCANIHVLPDGRRVNYGKNGFTIIQSSANGPGDHASPTTGGFPSGPQSALTSSLYNEQAFGEGSLHAGPGADNGNHDAGYSLPSSTYGSPREDFAFSPNAGKGLSILDVPLPASFDSNGMSNAARFPSAPWPSSMPSKFGLDSPAASLANAKDARTSDTLKLLHSSAFGGPNDFLGAAIGSPPSSQMAGGDEFYGKRAMHSARYSKPKMMSASVPKGVDRDWDAGFDFGDDDDIPENYVPENLQDLLTPAEKARRGSMRGENDVGADILTKYGSPLGNSPSRWGPLFQRQKEEEELSKSARNVSAFGHVGSPLRNSTLAMNKGSLAGSIGSNRPSMRLGDDSMSALSQQLKDSTLDETSSSTSHLHPASARGPAPIGKERHTSTGSISSPRAARFAATIDEEDPDFVFSMEEDEPSAKNRKRVSSGIAMASYAGVASGKSQPEAKDAKTAPS